MLEHLSNLGIRQPKGKVLIVKTAFAAGFPFSNASQREIYRLSGRENFMRKVVAFDLAK